MPDGRARVRRTLAAIGVRSEPQQDGAEPPPFDIRKHLPSAAAVLLMIEVFGVSDFSVTSSLAIASTASITTVVTGAAIALLPYLLPIVCLLALARMVQQYASGAAADTLIVSGAIFVAALLLSAWKNVLIIAAASLVYVAVFAAVARISARWGSAHDDRPVRLRTFPMILVGLLIAFFLTLTEPWVAPEVITVTATPAVAASLEPRDGFVRVGNTYRGIGYPLDTGGGNLSVLARTTRRIVRFPSSAVLSRKICRYDLPVYREVLLHDLLGHSDKPPNPACPSVEELE
jgi:hypothetical protein